jgi:hypothetical protein
MNMAESRFRVLKREGRVTLIETVNPTMGTGYSVKIGNLGLWSGGDLIDAEREFERATANAG